MNRFTKELVDDLANKLLIGLTEEENSSVLHEFEDIDKQIDLINEIPNIESVSPMTHALDDFVFELREDVSEGSSSVEDLFSNSDMHTEREIEVPKVVG